MQVKHVLIDFILKEWLLTVSIASLVLASIYTKNFPVYSTQEFQILFILFVLFIVVNGLQRSGLILKLSQSIDEGKAIPLKLLIITFFLSMVITNDITLIVIVPLTLALNINRKDILVIFEALSANAGSALTPFGNPQNLFIYWFYGLHPIEFIAAIAPLSIIFLLVLFAASLFIKTNNSQIFSETKKTGKYAYIYGILLLIVLLIVLHVLPLIAGLIIIIFVLFRAC
ncbi:hypothetical protein J7K93_00345 [bacterium]|nr:hypothetical protein [bacterium]